MSAGLPTPQTLCLSLVKEGIPVQSYNCALSNFLERNLLAGILIQHLEEVISFCLYHTLWGFLFYIGDVSFLAWDL